MPEGGAGGGSGPGRRSAAGRFARGMREYYAGPYRRALAREARDEEDLFMLVVLGEALGVPNPAGYYTLELLPAVYDQVHDWHRRIGLDRSPLDSVTCC